MIQIVREVSADVIKRGSTRAIYAKQHDVNSRFLNIRIQEEGKDLIVDADSLIALNVERPDKKENMFYGSVNEDGTIRVPMTAWMLELEGTLMCDVSIIKRAPDGTEVSRLTTMQFNIHVEAAVLGDSDFEETEEYSIIVDLLNRVQASAGVAAEAARNAEAVSQACVQATEDANKAATDVETALAELSEGGFIEGIKDKNKGIILGFWIGSSEEYKSLEKPPKDCYVILNDEVPRLGDVLFDGELILSNVTTDINITVKDISKCTLLLLVCGSTNLSYFGTVQAYIDGTSIRAIGWAHHEQYWSPFNIKVSLILDGDVITAGYGVIREDVKNPLTELYVGPLTIRKIIAMF